MLASYVGSCVGMAAAIWAWGAVEVRGHIGPVAFLTGVGVVWLFANVQLFSWVGLSIVDDVLERRNQAAFFSLQGATLAVAMIFTGGNLGEGPSYWNNIFSGVVGTCGFFVLWVGVELLSGMSRSIAEERDLASGIRSGGLLLALGLIIGRGIAGDWHSEWGTVRDLCRDAWPACIIAVAFVVGEYLWKPRAGHRGSWFKIGLCPALGYLGLAVLWVLYLGPWEGMPK